MARPRPCVVCSEIFTPHPRAGVRQRTCSQPSCQRERHRRNCADWHGKNPGYDVERRLRQKLAHRPRPKAGGPEPTLSRNPIAALPWGVVRDAVGPVVQVLLEEIVGVLVGWARDAVAEEVEALRDQLRRAGALGARDAFAGPGPPA